MNKDFHILLGQLKNPKVNFEWSVPLILQIIVICLIIVTANDYSSIPKARCLSLCMTDQHYHCLRNLADI